MSYAPGTSGYRILEAQRYAGVVVIPCENRVPLGNQSIAGRIARRYHFLCPNDFSPLPILRIEPHNAPIAARRIHFGICPRCGQKWWGPRLGDLGPKKRPGRNRRRGGESLREIADEKERQEEADALAPRPHDCATREHDPDEWCPDCFVPGGKGAGT
jgi:hypothetical protein